MWHCGGYPGRPLTPEQSHPCSSVVVPWPRRLSTRRFPWPAGPVPRSPFPFPDDGPIALPDVLFHDHGGSGTAIRTGSSVIMKRLVLAPCPAITSVTAGPFTPHSRCLPKGPRHRGPLPPISRGERSTITSSVKAVTDGVSIRSRNRTAYFWTTRIHSDATSRRPEPGPAIRCLLWSGLAPRSRGRAGAGTAGVAGANVVAARFDGARHGWTASGRGLGDGVTDPGRGGYPGQPQSGGADRRGSPGVHFGGRGCQVVGWAEGDGAGAEPRGVAPT
jgi:hypothetical protein